MRVIQSEKILDNLTHCWHAWRNDNTQRTVKSDTPNAMVSCAFIKHEKFLLPDLVSKLLSGMLFETIVQMFSLCTLLTHSVDILPVAGTRKLICGIPPRLSELSLTCGGLTYEKQAR